MRSNLHRAGRPRSVQRTQNAIAQATVGKSRNVLGALLRLSLRAVGSAVDVESARRLCTGLTVTSVFDRLARNETEMYAVERNPFVEGRGVGVLARRPRPSVKVSGVEPEQSGPSAGFFIPRRVRLA